MDGLADLLGITPLTDGEGLMAPGQDSAYGVCAALWRAGGHGGIVMPDLTISDRLALAVCEFGCSHSCAICRDRSAAVAHEVAAILRERHGGSSATADWLDGVGCHE